VKFLVLLLIQDFANEIVDIPLIRRRLQMQRNRRYRGLRFILGINVLVAFANVLLAVNEYYINKLNKLSELNSLLYLILSAMLFVSMSLLLIFHSRIIDLLERK
jgi:hypothetical protein